MGLMKRMNIRTLLVQIRLFQYILTISSDSSADSGGHFLDECSCSVDDTIPNNYFCPDTTTIITSTRLTQTDTPVIPTETPIIAPTIPPSPDYTPASPDYSPASDSESDPFEDPSSDHIPPLPAISPFLSSDDDTTDSDTPDTPPSPTHGMPFTEITASTQRSPIIPRRRVMILSPGQPIPHVNHSSSEASSDFHSDASSDSSSRHSLSDHSSPDLPSTSAGPSRKRHLEDALRDRGIDARVVVEAVDRDETETGVRGPVEGQNIIGFEIGITRFAERVLLSWRGITMSFRGTHELLRVRELTDSTQRGMSRMQRELRQMRRLRFYDRVRVGILEACARKHIGYHP
ncbi:hypothetical protein Tco_0661118 [Tanacetum coccineum]